MVGWLTDWMTGCMINDFNVKRKLDHEILLTTNSLTLTQRSPPPPGKSGYPTKKKLQHCQRLYKKWILCILEETGREELFKITS